MAAYININARFNLGSRDSGGGFACFRARFQGRRAPLRKKAVVPKANDADLETKLGTALASAGDLPPAVQALERALAVAPDHEQAPMRPSASREFRALPAPWFPAVWLASFQAAF